MKQTSKRVLSLLMALTMLIGMMTAVTVSAEVVDYEVVKTINFDDYELGKESSSAAGSYKEIYTSCTATIVANPEDSNDLEVLVSGATSLPQHRINFRNLPFEKGATYKITFNAKAHVPTGVAVNMGTFSSGVTFKSAKALSNDWKSFELEYTHTTDTTTSGEIVMMTNVLTSPEVNQTWFDDIVVSKKVVLAAPVVESVTIDGAAQLGQTLKAIAVVTDANTNDTATASYQWQVQIDGDWKDISGATSETYVINENATVEEAQVDMLGKQVRVVVTPNSNNQPSPGTPVESEATQAIAESSLPPSGTGEGIVGDYEIYEVGQELEATFTYVPSASGVAKGDAEYIWETSEDEEFEGSITEVQKGTNNKYIVTLADAGKWLRVRIIPKDEDGLAGEELIVDAKQVKGDVAFYVSTEGNDANDGSKDHPFKTIEKARDTIRALDGNLPNGGIIVNIMGGTYEISDTIKFTAEDSGTEESPITYQAYNGEKVSFVGGETLLSSEIKKVTDEDILDSLVEEDAKDHLYMLDLGDQDVEMDPVQPYGIGYTRDTAQEKIKRIYMNNQLLTDARWPNDDQSQNLLNTIPVTKDKNADVAAGRLNAANTPIIYGYPDPENRSEKWVSGEFPVKEGDAIVGGAVVYYWAPTFLRIKEIDTEKKTVTSLDKSSYGSVSDAGWGGQCKVFFSNIFAEIDKPGESYVDRENNILYFYPIGSVENAEMVVSTFKKNMISLKEVSYVTFKGIDFKNTVETAINMYDCDHVTIAGAEISNITQSAIEMTNTTNTIIEECNIYNVGLHGVKIIGDDAVYQAPQEEKLKTIPENRRTLTKSGNEIRYNNFHNVNTFPDYNYGAIFMTYAVGEWIHHNEFNDIDLYTIRFNNCNDILIEYNKLMNLGSLNSDAGAINWGREFGSLGHTVRYNYFENIGSKLVSNHLLGHQSVSIFMDDATTGGNIYGNVFLNGGSNQLGTGTPVIGNGPEFSNVWGNISICTDFDRMRYTFNSRNWGTLDGLRNTYGIKNADLNPNTAIGSWVYHMGMRDAYGQMSSTLTSPAKREMMWLDSWKEHYKDTQWAPAITHYSKANYEGAKALYDAEDYKGVLLYLSDVLQKERTNKIHNNVSLGAVEEHPQSLSLGLYSNNYYGTQHAITEEDKALFVDFDNKDFTLTDAGLAKIQTKAPEFEAINFKEIGLGDKAVGGHKPVVTVKPENISGVVEEGYTISAAYTFTDADGDAEGNTKIYWHVSEEEDGKYEPIYGGDETKKSEFGGVEGKKFEVLENYAGKYLKYEIIPADTTSLIGETVWSEPIYVPLHERLTYTVSDEKATITGYKGTLSGELTIPEMLNGYPVAAIGNDAFFDQTDLTKITVPDSVYSIGEWAFAYSGLEEIKLPKQLQEIADGTFAGCYSLKNIIVPDSVYSIGEDAFANSGLEEIQLPKQLQEIAYRTFASCESLKNITVPDSVYFIRPYAFADSGLEEIKLPKQLRGIAGSTFAGCYSLKKITIPDSVYFIGTAAFADSGLEEIQLPKQLKEIGNYAFRGCDSLKNVTVPDSVYSIRSYAFAYSGLEEIKLPKQLQEIADYAFYECDSLKNITVPDSVYSVGEGAFAYSGLEEIKLPKQLQEISREMFYNCKSLDHVTIPNMVSHIAAYACYGNLSLQYITIPRTVTEIMHNAFSDCPNLSDVYYEGSEDDWEQISIGAYNGGLLDATIHFHSEDRYGDIFYQLNQNGQVTITGYENPTASELILPEMINGYPVTSIGDSAFSCCENLTNIIIPVSVVSIGSRAFYDCTGLTSITIPDSVAFIGDNAFINTAYYNDKSNWKNGLLYIDNHLIGVNTFVSDVKMKESTKTITDSAFKGCTRLTSITIPDSVATIGNNAFESCTGLTTITIPNSVAMIGNSAFKSCSGLTSITIPDNVTFIGDDAFDSCYNLTINCEIDSYALAYALENHYIYNIVEISNPTITGKAQRVNGKIVVYAEPSKTVINRCLHVALYDSNNAMIDYIIVPTVKPFDHTNVVFKDNNKASYAKIFLWNSLSSLEPIADAYKVEIQ